MKNTRLCPKCGGREIVVMRGNLNDGEDPKVRFKGLLGWKAQNFLTVNRYLCCGCGYLESWVDPEEFVRAGGKDYWEKWEAQTIALEEEQADREKLREEQEKEARQDRAAEKRKDARRDDPWN